jgi:transposase-like protein
MPAQSSLEERAMGESDRPVGNELPDPAAKRWTANRKAQVVAAIQAQQLTSMEACQRYGLTFEELASWERSFDWGGKRGLTGAGAAWAYAGRVKNRPSLRGHRPQCSRQLSPGAQLRLILDRQERVLRPPQRVSRVGAVNGSGRENLGMPKGGA